MESRAIRLWRIVPWMERFVFPTPFAADNSAVISPCTDRGEPLVASRCGSVSPFFISAILQGSNSGLASVVDPISSPNWETIDARSCIDIATGWPKTTRTTTTRIFPLASPRTFRSYRLCITENNGSEYTALMEFDFNK